MNIYIGLGFVKVILAALIIIILSIVHNRLKDKVPAVEGIVFAIPCLLLWFGAFSVLGLWM
jgi:multisubunit Na+/H+ antiporter MnhF subunit